MLAGIRYRVEYRLGGRGIAKRYAGSFQTMREATIRRTGSLASWPRRRAPDYDCLAAEPPKVPTLREAAESWRASRIDVDEGTRTNDRVNTERVFKHDPTPRRAARSTRSTSSGWAQVFAELAAALQARHAEEVEGGVLRCSTTTTAIEPNPVRDKRVKLPHERKRDLIVPLAAHVEAVAACSRASTCSRTS